MALVKLIYMSKHNVVVYLICHLSFQLINNQLFQFHFTDFFGLAKHSLKSILTDKKVKYYKHFLKKICINIKMPLLLRNKKIQLLKNDSVLKY